MKSRLIKKTGLYDPTYEHDSCGVGFVANIKGVDWQSLKLLPDREI
tara:strand:- start:477 stop:614 length:138 start_codon:yes stop_codon:yes gene_type:complete